MSVGPQDGVKQVIVLRTDLGMRKGKMIAQGAHASLKAVLDLMEPGDGGTRVLRPGKALESWLSGLYRKIVVGVASEEELIRLRDKAAEMNLPYCLVTDAGLTEFHGIPTRTALAVGPASDILVDAVTGGLPLL